jgi:hypothetical protein
MVSPVKRVFFLILHPAKHIDCSTIKHKALGHALHDQEPFQYCLDQVSINLQHRRLEQGVPPFPEVCLGALSPVSECVDGYRPAN